MAQVTVELRHLLQTDFELFDFDYQFDDPNFKRELEQSIIDYYYFYEIGQETPEAFKHTFKTRFKRLIGYYNKLHNTTLLTYNPLINYKMEEALDQLAQVNNQQSTANDTSHDGTVNTTNNNESTESMSGSSETSENTHTHDNEKMSDYPQQSISAGDYLSGERDRNTENEQTQNVTSESNTSTSSEDEGSTTSQENTNSTGTSEEHGTTNTTYEKTIEGLTGTSYQDLIMKERENVLRLTGMIIEELKPCFILTY